VDASKPSQFSQFLPSRQRYVVWCCHDGRQRSASIHFSCSLPISIASIALIVNSRDQTQSFCLAVTAHSGRFFFNPIKYTAFSLASIRTCYRLRSRLTSTTTFSNIIVVCCLFIARYQSFQKWFIYCFVSAIHKLKFGLLNVLNHVASKHRAFLCIQPYAYPTIL